ncbi:chromogranin-A [Solea senegalensis]|uniref:Chromogranin-A n=1 Tax=Solea senegalensis TaxID=28829 RepID=A0AAV6RWS7_SOLSE|nr:chromogranin-A [Solea senegalensis]KAG7509399.1 chromogranin-A [Solea senegalensis]
MIGRGLFIVTVLSNCVLSLPVTSSQLENEDVKVMKCIVEALADVLSRPHPVPVSQECLVLLRTDDRLVTILRHQNFLKELQEIAVHGGQERAQVQRDAAAPAAMTQTPQTPQTADAASDRSMLEALGSIGERSILSQKRKTENGDGGEEKAESLKDGDSREDSVDIMEETPVKREEDESPGSHVSESVDEWREGKAGKREDEDEDEEEEEEEEKRAHSEESSEEEEKENLSKKEKGAASEDKRDAPRHKSKEQTLGEEGEEEEEDKRSSFLSNKHEEEEEGDVKRGSKESGKQWNKRGKGLRLKKKAERKEAQQLAHHSKEAAEDEEAKKKRDAQKSPEEKELQMIAGRSPEERKGLEEEGSASRKSEEPEIESLAAIESELENVAQKLHELRRG